MSSFKFYQLTLSAILIGCLATSLIDRSFAAPQYGGQYRPNATLVKPAQHYPGGPQPHVNYTHPAIGGNIIGLGQNQSIPARWVPAQTVQHHRPANPPPHPHVHLFY